MIAATTTIRIKLESLFGLRAGRLLAEGFRIRFLPTKRGKDGGKLTMSELVDNARLTPAQEASAILRRKAIYEDLRSEARAVAARER